jgi:hypothetical protein
LLEANPKRSPAFSVAMAAAASAPMTADLPVLMADVIAVRLPGVHIMVPVSV